MSIKDRIKEKTKKTVKEACSPRNIIMNIVEATIAGLILFTFFGNYIIGQNLPPVYLIIVLAIYLTYVIYKRICHIQDILEEEKAKRQIETSSAKRKKRK